MPSDNEIAVEGFWGPFWSKGDLSAAEEIFDPPASRRHPDPHLRIATGRRRAG
ncbi:MAG: hypothetical protein LC792_05370 [Actinobacteria bacterium]|nr:hypothetical protein [Actinomycetota bacterium]